MLPQEEACPVPEHLIGQLYRANAHGLDELVATVPAKTRAMLALYCYRRTHLQSIGLAVAASCEEHDLAEFGGHAGRVLFDIARQAPEKTRQSYYTECRNVAVEWRDHAGCDRPRLNLRHFFSKQSRACCMTKIVCVMFVAFGLPVVAGCASSRIGDSGLSITGDENGGQIPGSVGKSQKPAFEIVTAYCAKFGKKGFITKMDFESGTMTFECRQQRAKPVA